MFCKILYGDFLKIVDGNRGPIVFFDPGKTVAYFVEIQKIPKLFIFRTTSGEGSFLIGGVSPGVLLLVETKTKGKTTRLRNVLNYLMKNNINLDELSELFYLRLASIIEGREFRLKHLRKFLSDEKF